LSTFFKKLFNKQSSDKVSVPDKPFDTNETNINGEAAADNGIPDTDGSIPVSNEIPTIPITEDYHLDDEFFQKAVDEPSLIKPPLIVGSAQSIGRQRDHNEDSLFTFTTNITSGAEIMPIGLYIVADGMGGHKHGEIASELAVRAMSTELLNKALISLISIDPTPPDESIQEIMENGVRNAHQAIINKVPGGGTTLTASLIVGNQVTIAHVGDSRAYRISPDGEIESLTQDHSLVMRMMEMGQITAEEAAVHPQRNVLYRALGQGEPFAPDISTTSLPESSYMLVCSDGLWGVISEEEILQIITTSTDPNHACLKLVNAANNAGGPDNITAVLIQLPG